MAFLKYVYRKFTKNLNKTLCVLLLLGLTVHIIRFFLLVNMNNNQHNLQKLKVSDDSTSPQLKVEPIEPSTTQTILENVMKARQMNNKSILHQTKIELKKSTINLQTNRKFQKELERKKRDGYNYTIKPTLTNIVPIKPRTNLGTNRGVRKGWRRKKVGGYVGTPARRTVLPPHVSNHKSQTKLSISIALHNFDNSFMGKVFRTVNMSKCYSQYDRCILSYTKQVSDVERSKHDAVIFHVNDLPKHPPKQRNEGQIFIFFASYPKVTMPVAQQIPAKWKNQFNWTMTYRLSSDIPIPHGAIVPNDIHIYMGFGVPYINADYNNHMRKRLTKILNRNYLQVYKSKKSDIAWIQLQCSSNSKSEEYVKKLQKHVPVDIYGNCLNSSDEKPLNPAQIVDEYKFLLAFEDLMCLDYITNTVFSWFQRNIVLVVRGAKSYDKQLPHGSYIDTNNFKYIKDLANYLIQVGGNEKRYTALLRKIDHYKVIDMSGVAQKALCEVCNRLINVDKHEKTVNDIDAWWREQDQCEIPRDIKH